MFIFTYFSSTFSLILSIHPCCLTMKSLNYRSLLILFITSQTLHAIQIGSVANATFHAWSFIQIYPILTCKECTCTALMLSAAGWNCMIMNKTCQLISNYSSNDIGLKNAINTTFSFQQFPFKQLTTQTGKLNSNT